MHGQVALVTGGGQGLGQAISQRRADAGGHFVVADRNEPAAIATAHAIHHAIHHAIQLATPKEAPAVCADITVETDVAAMVAQTMRAFGRIDLLSRQRGRRACRGDNHTFRR